MKPFKDAARRHPIHTLELKIRDHQAMREWAKKEASKKWPYGCTSVTRANKKRAYYRQYVRELSEKIRRLRQAIKILNREMKS